MKSSTSIIRRAAGRSLGLCLVAIAVAALCAASLALAAAGPKQFASPDDAVTALASAIRSGDEKELLAIFGPDSRQLISSGDEVADRAGRGKFITSYDQKHLLKKASASTMILHTGNDEWPLPIPIVKRKGGWSFDISKTKGEMLKRRIGRNELQVMEVLSAYVDAQHEYASRDCSGQGKVEFAQRIISTPGLRDGLYWEAAEGEEQSPLGPLVAKAARDGYSTNGDLSPFHGYYFKILKAQGKHAPGGAYSYLVKDRMILGFALVAYPAEYGNSGVMTFMVSQDGTIYEKNLGKNTATTAAALKSFDPDRSWKPVHGEEEMKATKKK